MIEEWRKISEFGHEISNIGNIRNKSGTPLKAWTLSSGYKQIQFNNKGKKFLVHRLVLLAFKPNPTNLPNVNHLNHDRSDNRLENLEWCTQSRNIQYAYDCKRMIKKGVKHHLAKLDETQVITIKSILKTQEATHQELANYFGVVRATITSIAMGINWSHL